MFFHSRFTLFDELFFAELTAPPQLTVRRLVYVEPKFKQLYATLILKTDLSEWYICGQMWG